MSDSRGVLVMAPAASLANLADIIAAANGGMRVTVLDGMVTGREMLREIGSGRYEVVYFGGHGDEDGLTASDGRLNEEFLRQALRNASVSRLQLVILNSCDSISPAAALYRAGVAPRVIGWPGEVVDGAAISWARAFFRSLAMGTDYWEAYALSLEVLRLEFPQQRPPELLNGRISLLEQQVAGIQSQLQGALMVPRWTVAAVLGLAALTAAITMASLVSALWR